MFALASHFTYVKECLSMEMSVLFKQPWSEINGFILCYSQK